MRLFEIEPDLLRYVPAAQRAHVARLRFPVRRLSRGPVDMPALLAKAGGFGAIVLDGMLLHRQTLGDRGGARLLGAGDFLSVTHLPRSSVVGESVCRAVTPSRIVVLGLDLLRAIQRFPQITAGLYARMAEQSERIIAQLMICQLPKVEDRVLSMLWLLAEVWGRVGSTGTVLPLSLTHEAIGALVGARRSTVTLAVRDLTERGALLRQDSGWLLLAEHAPSGTASVPEEPRLLRDEATPWAIPAGADDSPDAPAPVEHDELAPVMERLSALRARHALAASENRAFLAAARRSRRRAVELRGEGWSPDQPPSGSINRIAPETLPSDTVPNGST